jgi:hypothetical protein
LESQAWSKTFLQCTIKKAKTFAQLIYTYIASMSNFKRYENQSLHINSYFGWKKRLGPDIFYSTPLNQIAAYADNFTVYYIDIACKDNFKRLENSSLHITLYFFERKAWPKNFYCAS